MSESVPSDIKISENEDVLNFIQDLSAHDGVASILVESVKPLGDVQIYCPDWATYRYVVVSTMNIIFGVAYGMNTVAFKLSPEFLEKALVSGCKELPELGSDWVWVNPNSGDWPEVDFKFWARKSYVCTRKSDAS